MRRKRFQHCADTLCHMFCGWQLMADYSTLERLGSGTLRMDVISEECSHDGEPVPVLSIGRGLRAWLIDELAKHSIPLTTVSEASITVRFETEKHRGQRQAGSWSYPQAFFVGCTLSCTSVVRSGPDVYTSSFVDHEEWPTPFKWE